MASRITTSSTEMTRPDSALPAKYAALGMGVPTSRFSVPSSRSMAMLMPRLTNVTDMMPLAMIPAVKYWRKLTSVFGTVPWKIDPKMTRRMTGSENVKTTASRRRKNVLSSRPARPNDRLVMDGSATADAWAALVVAVIELLQLRRGNALAG